MYPPGIATSPRRSIDKAADNAHTSPLTPAVTGITFPSPTDTRSDNNRQRPSLRGIVPEPSLHPSSSDDSVAPITPTDIESLDQLWGSLRLEKERKMAQEPPKIKSLEGSTLTPSRTPMAPPEPHHTLKKQISLATFHESPDGRTMMAKFDMPGIKKQDVHVSFQRTRLVVTWETVNVTEREENERIVRERKEKIFSETIPLPDGTKFEEVRAAMDSRHLILKYPSMHPSKRAGSRLRDHNLS